MYKFKGSLLVESGGRVGPKEFVSYENFVERGCSLQNTEWVIGVVVYSGHDTKIMMNSIDGRMKNSRIEHQMNRQIIVVFLFLIGMCIFCAIYYTLWYDSQKDDVQEYLHIGRGDAESKPVINFFLRIAMWFLLLSSCVPISLVVTLEMVRFL